MSTPSGDVACDDNSIPFRPLILGAGKTRVSTTFRSLPHFLLGRRPLTRSLLGLYPS